jgi:hypothetical protein
MAVVTHYTLLATVMLCTGCRGCAVCGLASWLHHIANQGQQLLQQQQSRECSSGLRGAYAACVPVEAER